jgi:hypothetical protein
MLANTVVLFGPMFICDTLMHRTRSMLSNYRTIALALSLTVVLCSAIAAHKFYVSKTTLEVNPRTNEAEITMKIFTDDLDRALGQDEKTRDHSALPDYVYQHCWLKFNDQPLALNFVGSEIENDITYIYFGIQPVGACHVWEVHNSILMDAIPEQQNLFDLSWNGNTKTLIFTKDHTTEKVFY